jgi:TetR/AcrR family transcriptional regulator
MVSQQRRPRPGSRDRLLLVAAAEFAARGFDGTTVDRIAARARLNKAMLYYHFDSKAALYRAILLDVFRGVAGAVAAAAAAGDPPARLRAFIRALAAETADRPHFPLMWLREIADGGRHLDREVVAELGRVLATLKAVLDDGVRQGAFRDVHPLMLQMNIVAPLLVFRASATARARFARALPPSLAALDPNVFLAHVEAATLAAVAR